MMSTHTLSPTKQARRRKILEKAEHAFVADGFRATTMEGIARAAGMSKVTVYGYFGDKDAIFDAVAERIADATRDVFVQAIQGSGAARDRITAALIAKHDLIHKRVRQSRFATELFSVKNRACASRFQELDQGFVSDIRQALTGAGQTAATADHLAKIVFSAAQGIANDAETPTILADQIRTIMQIIPADQPPK